MGGVLARSMPGMPRRRLSQPPSPDYNAAPAPRIDRVDGYHYTTSHRAADRSCEAGRCHAHSADPADPRALEPAEHDGDAGMALVTIAETAFVGTLGTPPLAGLALVFPLVMLQQMMSGGAIGGGVSSAISRALA